MLEIAVVLLGASVSIRAVLAIGPELIVGIAIVVVVAIATSYAISRALGLRPRMAILVACGNSICGNSAIAAVAPVIGADGEDVASSIAFTAVLGVIVVLLLPLLVPLLQMSLTQYGVMAGLTVYAVPQVLAATLPIGALSNQVGTVVKLVRVLMLGPVVLLMSVLASKLRDETDEPAPEVTAGDRPKPGKPALHQLVPWFIVGFLVVAGVRTAGLIPNPVLQPTAVVANLLTTVSMAALGLGVDIRAVAKAGLRVTGAVTLSLVVLGFEIFAPRVRPHGLNTLTRSRNQLESGPLRAEPQCLPLRFATSATPRLPSNGSGFGPVPTNAESPESGVRQEDAEKANRRYEVREMLPPS